MGLFGNKYIRVVFQVERTGEKLGFSEMKVKQIPESWKWETQVTVAGKEWEVAHVDPEHRKEMLKNGELRVYVRRADSGKTHEVEVPQTDAPTPIMPVSHAVSIAIDPETEPELGEDMIAGADLGVEAQPETEVEAEPMHQAPEPETATTEEMPTLVPIEFTGIIEPEQPNVPELEAEPELVPEPEPEPENLPKPEFAEDEVALPWPTISGTLPETEQGTWGNEYFSVHEDLWRQIEWVDAAREEDVQQTFRQINHIYEHHCFFRQGYRYFSQLHERNEWTSPISNTVSLDELRLDFFPGRKDFEGVLIDAKGRVKNGFAFQMESGLVCYGVQVEGMVSRLALAGPDNLEVESLAMELDSMVTLMRDYGWVLVDWLEQQRVAADGEDLRAFLLGG